jgi:hypothetical protein
MAAHHMIRRTQIRDTVPRMALAALAALVVLAAPTSTAASEAARKSLKEKLVGTWFFVSSTNTRKDGSTYDRWGPNPKGILMFDADGRYSQIIMRAETSLFGPKTIFSFGTFTIDEAKSTIVTEIEGGSLSKLNGTQQRRIVKVLTADELRYVNLDGFSGAVIDAVWRRAPPPRAHSATLNRTQPR